MTSFEDLGVSPDIARAAAEMGWTEPTPVQIEAVPAGLGGRDIIAKAQTGTGKTGAYSMIAMTRAGPGAKIPSVLIITPTRELAVQVDSEVRRLSKVSGHCSVPVYGGADMRRQSDDIRRGADIIVGTPGRLRDMCERGILVLDGVREVVIDEADRMMEMGFEEDLGAVLEHVPSGRHAMMFSATMTRAVERLEKDMLNDPAVVDASDGNAVTGLTKQYVVKCRRDEKKDVLKTILSRGTPKAIVFCATKAMVDDLFQDMRADSKVGTLHGDMPQSLRERVIRNFRDNRVLVLIATDVAARGLDIEDVDLVVNYDAPSRAETYIHRIGRTGRAGREGISLTLATKRDMDFVRDYENEIDMRIRSIDVEDIEPFETVHEPVRRERRPRFEKPRRAEAPEKAARKASARPQRADDCMVVEVNLGKADGVNRIQLADLVRKRAGLGEGDVGKVGLGASSSFIEVPADAADLVIESVNGSVHGGKTVACGYAPEKRRFEERGARQGFMNARIMSQTS